MGFSFTNIQIRKNGAFDRALADAIASLIANGRGWRQVDGPDEAALCTVVAGREESPWIAVSSDAFDGDPDAQVNAARALSEALGADALAIGCFDSDYLYLNLVNPSKGVDLWAASGCAAAADMAGLRRSGFRAWRGQVPDTEAFRAVMKRSRVFAEECLSDLEPMLNLPAAQSVGGGGDWPDAPGVYRYYYKLEEKQGAAEPPRLEWHFTSGFAPREGEECMLCAVNRGGASRGLGVAFTGAAVERGEIAVWSAFIQVRNRRGEWENHAVEIEEARSADGMRMLYGQLPSLPIPEGVSCALPDKKRMELEFERGVALKFVPESLSAACAGERLTDLCAYLIPLENWSGQCGWIGRTEEDGE